MCRWGKLFPLCFADRKPLEVSDEWLQQKLANAEFVGKARARLADLGWLMKCLKEPRQTIQRNSFLYEGHIPVSAS